MELSCIQDLLSDIPFEHCIHHQLLHETVQSPLLYRFLLWTPAHYELLDPVKLHTLLNSLTLRHPGNASHTIHTIMVFTLCSPFSVHHLHHYAPFTLCSPFSVHHLHHYAPFTLCSPFSVHHLHHYALCSPFSVHHLHHHAPFTLCTHPTVDRYTYLQVDYRKKVSHFHTQNQ